MAKPRLAVWKFASCDGCQLTILDCEDALLEIADRIDIVHFLEASSRVEDGPYDISLVEGSITTAEDAERIRRIRDRSTVLIAIGACATAGGIQALRNFTDVGDYVGAVYARPDYIRTLATSEAIADHVPVDHELRGCPISRHQLLDLIGATLTGRRPRPSTAPQCTECKAHGSACVMVTEHAPCLGPVTQAGCGNLCPSVGRPCYGCFGPVAHANTAALADRFLQSGVDPARVRDLFRSFNAGAGAFADESRRHG